MFRPSETEFLSPHTIFSENFPPTFITVSADDGIVDVPMMGTTAYSTNHFFHFGSGSSGYYDDVEFLSQCIADVNLVRAPDLSIFDGTEVITTNGPSGQED